MALSDLTKGERFIFDWQYHLQGSFFAALAHAIAMADHINLAKLEKAFPDEVKAYFCFSTVDGWWEDVERKARQ